MANKITEREIYTSILNDEIDMTALKAFAEKKIAQLDHRNEKAKERLAVKRAEGDVITDRVFSVVSAEPQTRDAITAALGDETLSTAKVGARLNQLVNAGRVQKTNIKVAGADGKTSNKVAYFIG